MLALITVLGLAGCSGQGGQAGPEIVNVPLKAFSIQAAKTKFQAGKAYRFVAKNEGRFPHELMVIQPIDPAEAAKMSMEQKDSMALGLVSEDDLPPGGQGSVVITFSKPAKLGELELACHVPGHYEQGMKQAISVE
jgi:uncharacterized cupredoxin-like copper-binding protein